MYNYVKFGASRKNTSKGVMGMCAKDNDQNVEATEEEYALADQMAECLLKIWKLVGCFAIGFLLMMLGVTFMNYAVDAFFLGILCGGAGVLLMPLPSVLLIWQGAGLRAIFNTEYFIVTEYADGHSETTYDLGGTMVSKIITLAIAFALGFAITPIRILLGIITFKKAKKKLGIGKLPWKEDILLPFIVTVGAFVLGIVLNATITGIAEAKHEKEKWESDYTVEEAAQMLTDIKESLQEQSFTYFINGGYFEEGNRCLIEVKYDRGRYAFTVKAGYYYEYNGRAERVDWTEADSPIPFGEYVYENGVWAESAAVLSAEQKAIIESCTMEAYLAEFEKYEITVKDTSLEGKAGYRLSICRDEEEESSFEIYKGDSAEETSFGAPYRLLLGIIDGLYGGGCEIRFN